MICARKWLIRLHLVLGAVIAAGCATGPPPRIEGGRYIHPNYEFSIEVPKGWTQDKEVPDWLRKERPDEEQARGPDRVIVSDPIQHHLAYTKTIFWNKETQAAIAIGAHKTPIDYGRMPKQRIAELVARGLAAEKEYLTSLDFITDYSNRVVQTYCTEKPSPFEQRIFREKNARRIIQFDNRSFIYTCHQYGTCSIDLILLSDVSTFKKNLRVLDKLAESILRYIPPKESPEKR